MSATSNGNGHVEGAPTEDWASFYDYDQGREDGHEEGRREGYQLGFQRREALYDLDHDGKFATRPADRSKMRPVEFTWRPWIVRGRLNLMVGEEKVGKSTFSAYVAAGITTGTLSGQPADVLFVGADEDDWSSVTLPRLEAAGADFDRVHEFYAHDGAVFNAEAHATELGRLLREHEFALVVFEHLMDILPPMRSYTDPAAMRRALQPLRHELAAVNVAGLATLHVNKAQTAEFRQKSQGTVQFGAMARSSFLVDKHPSDPLRRVAVLAPTNYVRDDEPHALAFSIASHPFTCNGEPFDVGRVVDVEDENVSMADVLCSGSERDRKHDERTERVFDALDDEPRSGRAVAKLTGVSQPTTNRILHELEEDGLAAHRPGEGWVSHESNPRDMTHDSPPDDPEDGASEQPGLPF